VSDNATNKAGERALIGLISAIGGGLISLGVQYGDFLRLKSDMVSVDKRLNEAHETVAGMGTAIALLQQKQRWQLEAAAEPAQPKGKR
jgi:hypothetical protein